jgi:cytochrome P450
VLRELRALEHDSYAALDDLRSRYGDVVALGAGPARLVFLFGRDANEHVLSTNPGAFRWREAMKALIPVDGETALVVSDGADHARRRRLVQPGFHKRRIDGYLQLMAREADAVIDELTAGQVVDAQAAFRVAIRRTVVLALFGEHLRAQADSIGDTLQPAFDFINQSPLRQIKIPMPGSKYAKARAARAAVDRMIDDEIERRDAAGETDGDDVLTMLLAARDEDGSGLTRQEIRDQVVSLIAAGYDTTSAAMAWAVHRVLSEEGVLAQLRTELDEIVGDGPLTIEHLVRLPYLHGVVHETLRLNPPGIVAPRKAAEAFAFGGHHIRKGVLVFYSAYATGHDEASWPDAEAFRPERWDASRPDHVEPDRYAFVPFGGGARRCIGFAFATLELEVMLAQLVRRVDLELVSATPPRPTGIASVSPAGGVPVRILAVRHAAPVAG